MTGSCQPVSGHYYFPDYLEKKLAINDRLLRARNANNVVFPNGIKLDFNQKKQVRSKIIIDSLKAALIDENFKKIISISPFQLQRVWIILFKEPPTFILGKVLLIDDIQVAVIDASLTDRR